jgi:hypothetical protein
MGKLVHYTYTTTMAKFRTPGPSVEKHRPTFLVKQPIIVAMKPIAFSC